LLFDEYGNPLPPFPPPRFGLYPGDFPPYGDLGLPFRPLPPAWDLPPYGFRGGRRPMPFARDVLPPLDFEDLPPRYEDELDDSKHLIFTSRSVLSGQVHQ
jgi:hypothetical protein